MVRRISTSQLRSKLQQLQQKQKQAINKYNQGLRQLKQGVDKYNSAVRTHNSRVRANRQRLQSELRRLAGQSATTSTRFVVFRTSVQTVYQAYSRLEQDVEARGIGPQFNQVLDLSERETANSVGVMNSLLGTEAGEEDSDLQESALQGELRGISPDLDDRWRGAVFALDPRNPDAARHFCTSAREVFTQVLAIKAPREDVLETLPDCEKHDGKPTRRARIQYCLHRKGMSLDTLEEFVEQDMDNMVRLFNELSAATHGPAGHFSMRKLSAIKKRVEDGILFLTSVVTH